MKDRSKGRPKGPAEDRILHMFDQDGRETEPDRTKSSGRVVRGRAWFTTSPRDLAENGCDFRRARKEFAESPRTATVVRRKDGTVRPIVACPRSK